MGEQKIMSYSKKNKMFMIAVSILLIALLVGFECIIQVRGNEDRANKTSAMLVNQVEDVIDKNRQEEEALVASLKEDYITRARAVAYIIDHNPELEDDISELIKVASLISVDEIHLFDASGTIYGGTRPQYYGLSFGSGDQISYFKPMLEDKTLTMCQDVTPNTAEEKSMMYAICWNDNGTRMIQVGIEPVRLLEELRSNEISEVVENMPSYDGVDIVIADKESYEIEGATISGLIGRKLPDIGINLQNQDMTDICNMKTKVNGKSSYCVLHEYEDYVVAIIQDKATVNQEVPVTLLIVSLYLIAAAIAITFIMKRMTMHVLTEQKNANTDPLTGLYNRRGYENSLLEYADVPREDNFVYVSMDLNGLKVMNDTLGHSAGDLLLQGAAECMKQCFGNYGNLFRIGGDEFAAIIFTDENQLVKIKEDFENTTREWSEQNGKTLSVSVGFVKKQEYPEKTVSELAKIADARMYQNKEQYYKENGKIR